MAREERAADLTETKWVASGQAATRPSLPLPITAFLKLRKKPIGLVSFIVIVMMILLALFGDDLAPHAPDALVGSRLQDPDLGGDSRLGTDALGRDVLSRLMYGFRITVLVGFGAVAISTTLALLVGVTSGYFGGWYDTILQRVIDAVMAFPTLVLLLVVVSVTGPGLTQLILTLGLLSVAGSSRVIRSAVLSIRTMQYVEAANAIGAGPVHIMVRHILPNVLAPVMVTATVGLGGVILAEASLSFLGLGIAEPDQPTWGRMLFDARQVVASHPIQSLWPALLITAAVFSFNMFGDAIRDIGDPRLRGGS